MRLVLAVLGEESVTERPPATLIAGRISLRPCQLKSAINLIGGNMIEPLSFPTFRFPKLTGGLKQSQGAQDICLSEYERILDRAVNMALGGKGYDAINRIFRDHFADGLKVADVGLDESIVLAILYVLEIGRLPA